MTADELKIKVFDIMTEMQKLQEKANELTKEKNDLLKQLKELPIVLE